MMRWGIKKGWRGKWENGKDLILMVVGLEEEKCVSMRTLLLSDFLTILPGIICDPTRVRASSWVSEL